MLMMNPMLVLLNAHGMHELMMPVTVTILKLIHLQSKEPCFCL
jgi:hypothetical protein